MKKIRTRSRPDRLETDIRSTRRTLGRKLYFVLLAGFIVFALNYFFGDKVILRADGVIMRQEYKIDAGYPNIVTKIFAAEGDEVQKGDPLLEIMSLVDEKTRQTVTQETAQNIEIMIEKQFAASNISVLKENISPILAEACQDEATPDCKRAENIEANLLELQGQKADDSLNSDPVSQPIILEAQFSGIVSDKFAKLGEVFILGETMASVYFDPTFVLAYMPEEYILDIEIGDQMEIKYANNEISGRIEKILPISGILPVEFHNAIKAEGRNQLVRIQLDGETEIPLLQLVEVTKKNSILDKIKGVLSLN